MKRLDGNIGYVHLARFVPPDVFTEDPIVAVGDDLSEEEVDHLSI